MAYSIVTMKDLQFNQIIEIVKEGNTYNVDFTDKNTFITKKFRTLEEAQQVYLKIASYIIQGLYTFEQRAKELTDKELIK